MIKRLSTPEQRQEIRDKAKFRNKTVAQMTAKEKDEMLEFCGKKLGVLK